MDIKKQVGTAAPSALPQALDDYNSDEEDAWEYHPPTEAELKEREERRKESDRISALLGQKLLLGWAMLGDECPKCAAAPLMREKGSTNKVCVACNAVFGVNGLEISEGASNKATSQPLLKTSPAPYPSLAPHPLNVQQSSAVKDDNLLSLAQKNQMANSFSAQSSSQNSSPLLALSPIAMESSPIPTKSAQPVLSSTASLSSSAFLNRGSLSPQHSRLLSAPIQTLTTSNANSHIGTPIMQHRDYHDDRHRNGSDGTSQLTTDHSLLNGIKRDYAAHQLSDATSINEGKRRVFALTERTVLERLEEAQLALQKPNLSWATSKDIIEFIGQCLSVLEKIPPY